MPRDKDVKRVVRRRMAETGERYTEARAALRPRTTPPRTRDQRSGEASVGTGLIEVEIPVNIRLHLNTGQHFVVLKERHGDRWLSFAIGISEANAIAVVLSGMTLPRPLTPDLIVSSIDALGGDVERVVLTRIEKGVFYAEVQIRRDGVQLPPIDARPSDAFGVAVRTRAPIFVAAEIMDAAGGGPESVPVGATAEEMHALQEAGTPIRTAAFSPIIPPTHVLVDVASGLMVTMLGFPPGATDPSPGTELKLRAPEGWRTYRVMGIEAGTDGLTRLRVEVVAAPGGDEPIGSQPPIRD